MNPFIEGIHYYLNEEGLMVLTSTYLSERGYCCGNACQHCPFDYENVSEPARSKLLEARKVKNSKDIEPDR